MSNTSTQTPASRHKVSIANNSSTTAACNPGFRTGVSSGRPSLSSSTASPSSGTSAPQTSSPPTSTSPSSLSSTSDGSFSSVRRSGNPKTWISSLVSPHWRRPKSPKCLPRTLERRLRESSSKRLLALSSFSLSVFTCISHVVLS